MTLPTLTILVVEASQIQFLYESKKITNIIKSVNYFEISVYFTVFNCGVMDCKTLTRKFVFYFLK